MTPRARATALVGLVLATGLVILAAVMVSTTRPERHSAARQRGRRVTGRQRTGRRCWRRFDSRRLYVKRRARHA